MKIFPDRLDRVLDQELAPVYLFAGPEMLLVLEACDAVRRACRAQGIEERIVLDASGKFDWNELGLATETGSLFASRRLVELRIPNGKPGREGSTAIKNWLEGDPDDVLLISCMEWKVDSERGAWVRAIEKHGVFMPAWTIKPAHLPRWLQARARAKGLSLDNSAAAFLAELMEGNLLAAAQTIDRLALNPPPGEKLDLEGLKSAVDDHARFDAFRLSELVLLGDTARALRCCQGLKAEDVPQAMIVAALAGDLKKLQGLHAMPGNMPMEKAMTSLGIFKSKQPQFRTALDRLSPARVNNALARLSPIDQLSKGQVFGDFWQALERWVLESTVAPGRSAAA